MTVRWIAGGCAAAVVAVITTVTVTSDSSENGYRDTVLGIAHDGLSAVRTTDLLATTEQGGRLLSTYRSRATDDAETGLADALTELEGTDRPGPAAANLYDRLAPLLRSGLEAVSEAAAAMSAGTANLPAAQHKLRATGDGLAEFIKSVR